MEDFNVALIVLGVIVLLLSILTLCFPWLVSWGEARNNDTKNYRFWAPWRTYQLPVR